MFKFFSLLALVAACNSTPVQSAEKAVIDCLKNEQKVASSGGDVIQLGFTVATQYATKVAQGVASGMSLDQAALAAIEALVEQYGEGVVACVLKDAMPAPAAGSASTGEEDPLVTATRHAISVRGWQYK